MSQTEREHGHSPAAYMDDDERMTQGPTSRGTVPRRDAARTPGTRTRDELYEEAKALGIPGRSSMDKQQLEMAIDRRRGRRR